LAPIFNISEFIKNEIKGATAIHINMFLVSRGKSKSADLIKSLADAAKKGASISLMIDGGRYTALAFMQKAISDLKILAPAVRVTTVYMHQGCFHDKLLLITKPSERVVIVGSAGFTQNVQDNNNYENMLLIRDDTIFDYFLNHIRAIKSPKISKLESF
jgi:phosphatidylserine/phosphatidylglycerophosphate/cardiolipin synthase-like enzyme